LGFFGYAYYAENQKRLKSVPIVNKAGKAVSPSMEAVIDGSYNPLARPIFIYVAEKSLSKPEVKEFVGYYLTNVAKLAREVKYVPLPAKAYDLGKEHLAKGKVGTVFKGGSEVGVTIDELMRREAAL
jgi:phosphate transport system substrate-binding protein